MHNQVRQQVRINGKSLAIVGDQNQDWFTGWSPGDKSTGAEGPWEEWVLLARAILDENEKRPPSPEAINRVPHQQSQR